MQTEVEQPGHSRVSRVGHDHHQPRQCGAGRAGRGRRPPRAADRRRVRDDPRRARRAPGVVLPRPGPRRRPAARVRVALRHARCVPRRAHDGLRPRHELHRGHAGQPSRRRRVAHRHQLGRRTAEDRRAQRAHHPGVRRRHHVGQPVRRVRRALARDAGDLQRPDRGAPRGAEVPRGDRLVRWAPRSPRGSSASSRPPSTLSCARTR